MFYCELFARLGFETVAVEPLPIESLRHICTHHKVRLIESCISDRDGTCTLYVGTYQGTKNLNLSSISPEWWGRSSESVQVRSLTLSSLVAGLKARQITCMKIDVEGVEPVIIEQFLRLPNRLLPSVVVFEYGGGASRQSNQGGWGAEYLEGTMSCLRILRHLGYGLTTRIDSSPNSGHEIFDLTTVEITPERLFDSHNIYGNFVVFRVPTISTALLRGVCQDYFDNDVEPPEALPIGDRGKTALANLGNRLFHR